MTYGDLEIYEVHDIGKALEDMHNKSLWGYSSALSDREAKEEAVRTLIEELDRYDLQITRK